MPYSHTSFKLGDQVETNKEYKTQIIELNKRPGRFYPKYYMGSIIYIKSYPKYAIIQLDSGYVFGDSELQKVC